MSNFRVIGHDGGYMCGFALEDVDIAICGSDVPCVCEACGTEPDKIAFSTKDAESAKKETKPVPVRRVFGNVCT